MKILPWSWLLKNTPSRFLIPAMCLQPGKTGHENSVLGCFMVCLIESGSLLLLPTLSLPLWLWQHSWTPGLWTSVQGRSVPLVLILTSLLKETGVCSKNIELLFSQKKLCHHKKLKKLWTVLWLLLDTLPGWRRKECFQLHSSIKNIFLKEFCSLFQEPC